MTEILLTGTTILDENKSTVAFVPCFILYESLTFLSGHTIYCSTELCEKSADNKCFSLNKRAKMALYHSPECQTSFKSTGLLVQKFNLNTNKQNRFSRWQLWQSSWISDRKDFSCFCSIGLLVLEKKFKIELQNGSHLGLLIE